MKLNLITVLALTGLISANNHRNWLPPSDGRSFYVDFINEKDSIKLGKTF